VTFPLARPGVAGAALLVAIYVLADFGNPIMIAGSFIVLPTEAWYRVSGWGDVTGAAVLTSILLLPAFFFFVFQRYWVGKREYTTITGKVTLVDIPHDVGSEMVSLRLLQCRLTPHPLHFFWSGCRSLQQGMGI